MMPGIIQKLPGLKFYLKVGDGCFHIFAILNNTAINTGVFSSFQIHTFVFFEYVPRSMTAE